MGWGVQCRVACAFGARAVAVVAQNARPTVVVYPMSGVAQNARRTVGGMSDVGCSARCATYGGAVSDVA